VNRILSSTTQCRTSTLSVAQFDAPIPTAFPERQSENVLPGNPPQAPGQAILPSPHIRSIPLPTAFPVVSNSLSDLFDFLPGRIHFQPGIPADYRTLERFHYVARRPATWALVWRACYQPDRALPFTRLIGVAVLSYPVPTCRPRERYFNLNGQTYGQRLGFANANLRTISRVITHPQFRAIGLAKALVGCLLAHCPTRYVEAMAVMARVHPLFDRAGMKHIPAAPGEEYAYYVTERREHRDEASADAPP